MFRTDLLPQGELVDLVLGQQSSPSSSSTPETPITEAPSMTFDPPDPDLIPHTSAAFAAAPPSPPEGQSAESEVPPPLVETAPPEPDPQEDDQVSPRSSAGARPAATQSLSASPPIQVWDGDEAPVWGRRASLSDLSGPEDIEALSVRQLKEILARNFVDYKGCCEKWELMERVTRLYQDQQNLLGECTAAAEPL